MIYEVFVKGCSDGNIASCAFAIKSEDSDEVTARSRVFTDYILIKGYDIPVNSNAHFYMEIYALTWALSLCRDKDAEFHVYTNNTALASWVKNDTTPKCYAQIWNAYHAQANGRKVQANHIKREESPRALRDIRNECFRLIDSIKYA